MSTTPSPLILSVHESPRQGPDQNSTCEIASGTACSRTPLFRGKVQLQVAPDRHSMPVGAETTRPRPSPRMRTVNVSLPPVTHPNPPFPPELPTSQTLP